MLIEKHFSWDDRWRFLDHIENLNIEYMDFDFVDTLNQFGAFLNRQIVINQGAATSGHSTRSKHYQRPCAAVDFYVEGIDLDDLFGFASIFKSRNGFKFGAVGAYPYWNTPGLHCDFRQKRVFWFRDEDGEYHYSAKPSVIETKLTTIVEKIASKIDFCDSEF